MVDFHCSSGRISSFLEHAFSRPNARRVGELGFGTNISVLQPVSDNSHLNERVPGVHIGFGQHNQIDQVTGYFCDIHIDLIAAGGRVKCLERGFEINLANISPSEKPHPIIEMTEDVFSGEDCCGLVRAAPSAAA